MIGVYITINGTTIFARTAVNRLKDLGVYVGDDGQEIKHNPNDGAVKLAIKMLETIDEDYGKKTEPESYELELCQRCLQMTNHSEGVCQKCKRKKGAI